MQRSEGMPLNLERSPDESSQHHGDSWVLMALLAFFVLGASYFIVRSGGYWAENDTTEQTLVMRAISSTGELLPTTEKLYPNGYGYAAVSSVLMSFTGIDANMLQQLVYPILSVLLVFPAWVLYRELTGNRWAASLATFLLLSQPEFLFVVLRGSHERLLRILMLLSIWLLVRSFRFRDRPFHFAGHVVFFYLATFGIIAINSLFGISFVIATATGVIAAWVLGRLRPDLSPLARVVSGRLALITLTIVCLGFLFIFYVYPPATHGLRALDGVAEKLAMLFLSTDSTAQTAADPYLQVARGWTSLPTYFMLSAGDYLLLLVTVPIWLLQGARWIFGSRQKPSLAEWLLWLLYAAFALQGGIAIVSDRTGLLGGNLQYRSFPSFVMLATPLLAATIVRLRLRAWARVVGGITLALLAVLALLKATNEPGISNKWMFYTTGEMHALEWVDQHDSYAMTWVGMDERLRVAYLFAKGRSGQNNYWVTGLPVPNGTRLFLMSDVVRMESARLNTPLPPIAGANIIYDDGSAQIYRMPAETPFQH